MENNGFNQMPAGFGTIGSKAVSGQENVNLKNNDATNENQVINDFEGVKEENKETKAENSQNFKKASGEVKKAEKKAGNFENFLGRNLMGIFASVLVIIGLFLFVTAASEYITDIVKMVLIYFISFVALFIGLIGNRRIGKSPFFTCLSGCGVGAVYISIFMTFGYFAYVNVLVMFLMAAVWSTIVFFIGGKASALFHITGQCGLLVSLFYGMVEVFRNQVDSPELFILALLVFYICVTVFYALLDKNSHTGEKVALMIMNLLGLMFMFSAYGKEAENYTIWQQTIFTSILMLYSFWLSFIAYMKIGRIVPVAVEAETGKVIEESGSAVGWVIYFAFNVCMSGTAMIFAAAPFIGLGWIISVIGIVYVLINWIFLVLRKRDDSVYIVAMAVLILWAAIYITELDFLWELFGVGIIVIPLLVMAVAFKSRALMTISSFTIILFSFHKAEYPAFFAVLEMLFIFATILATVLIEKFNQSVHKIAMMVSASVFIYRIPAILVEQYGVEADIVQSIAYWFYAILLLACVVMQASKKKSTGKMDQNLRDAIYVFTVLAMLYGVSIVSTFTDDVLHILNLLALLLCVLINIPSTMATKTEGWALYNVIKITAYAVVAVLSYDADAYILTLCCMIVSIVSIVVGFVAERKTIRLYGLILSLISIVKLVFRDMSFESDIVRAIVVIACGILAFGICFVYSLVSRKVEEAERLEAEKLEAEKAGAKVDE